MSQDLEKDNAARASAQEVSSGMWLGLGTGSTAERMIHHLGARLRDEGLSIRGAVVTSERTRAAAEAAGLPVVTLAEAPDLDLYIDGADEVDPALNLVKGGGGALLHEKIVASASRRFIVIVDASKLVNRLGAFAIPVEVIGAAVPVVSRRIEALGGRAVRRERNGAPFVTLEGNVILDCDFGLLEDPARLAAALSTIPGVVEHGLFIGMAREVLVGRGDAVERRTPEGPA